MDTGCEGGLLHGGGVERGDISEVYFFKNDRIFTGLTVVEYLLADEGPGDGGVAVIPGSHKANLACPKSMIKWKSTKSTCSKVNGKAGDAIIFTETLTHGTLRGRPRTSGGAAVQIQPRNPVLWLGCAPDGVFRLHRGHDRGRAGRDGSAAH